VRNYLVFIISLTGLTACFDQGEQTAHMQQAQARQAQVIRNQDFAQIENGRKLFVANCSECHGNRAEGAPNWNRPDANGRNSAPPLNGSGHAWHHPTRALVNTIKYGTVRMGGHMPAWKNKLSDQDIKDVIAWFQSQWPDEVYAAWQRVDLAPR
jgi:mono/diheme cytochrome c family protein